MACKDILIVEDDPDIRDSLKEILQFEGYNPETASNGQEGVEKLRVMSNPCLILLDLMMPVMNGWQFLEYRALHSPLSSIPVVVVSAQTHQSKPAQVVAFLKKPLELDSFLKLVSIFCKKNN